MSRKKSLVLTLIVYLVTLVIGTITARYLHSIDYHLLYALLIIDVVMTIVVFIVSIIIRNSSMYDPYWSVIPPFIVAVTMVWLSNDTWVSYFILSGVLFWAIRLTRNWYIDFKGFSHEDFRYVDFQKKFGQSYWIISFLGIHLFPTVIVLISMYPIILVLEQTALTIPYIYFGVLIMIAGAIISFYADHQLRAHKKSKNKTSICTGLWKYSRHPNYFGEVFFWFGVYVLSFSVGIVLEASIGFIGMLLLFNLYSVPKMEQKLLHNKPDYQNIINNVPRFFIRPNNQVVEDSDLSEVAE